MHLLQHHQQQQHHQHNAHQQHPHHSHHQTHDPHHGISNGMSFHSDVDPHNSNLSLPSPSGSSHNGHMSAGLDAPDTKPIIQSVSVRRNTTTATSPLIQETKLHGLQQRLGLPAEVQLEFVNGGHGIKNPLAIKNTHGHRIRDEDKNECSGVRR